MASNVSRIALNHRLQHRHQDAAESAIPNTGDNPNTGDMSVQDVLSKAKTCNKKITPKYQSGLIQLSIKGGASNCSGRGCQKILAMAELPGSIKLQP